MFTEFFEKRNRKLSRENIDIVKQLAETILSGEILKGKRKFPCKEQRDLQRKVENHINRYNLVESPLSVIEQIIENDLVASLFAKSPTQQNLSEVLQVEYALSRGFVLKKLPAGGEDALEQALRALRLRLPVRNWPLRVGCFDLCCDQQDGVLLNADILQDVDASPFVVQLSQLQTVNRGAHDGDQVLERAVAILKVVLIDCKKS